MADALNKWLTLQRRKVSDGSATAKAIDYSLNRWAALTRYADDGGLPAKNNWVENQIRPIAIESNNRLFAGSLRSGKRAAAVMSLMNSAGLNEYGSVCLLEGRAPALAHAARQPRPGVAAASRAANHHRKLNKLAPVKTGSPDVYRRPYPASEHPRNHLFCHAYRAGKVQARRSKSLDELIVELQKSGIRVPKSATLEARIFGGLLRALWSTRRAVYGPNLCRGGRHMAALRKAR